MTSTARTTRNYEVYLEKQRVKAEAMRTNRSAAGGTVALRNGTGNLSKQYNKDYLAIQQAYHA
jgi:tripartite-type tricarboxylate transporter receptor subunit TctC